MNIEFFGTRSSKSLYRLSLVLLIIGSTACEAPRPQIRDLIQPLKLTAGKADSLRVSDLFYAEHYDLNFQPHPDIDAKLIGENLVLQPKSAFEGMATLAFDLDGQRYHIPVHSQIKPTYTFRFQPETKPGKISVMGTFNSWNRSDTPMHDEDGDGVYEVTLALDAGRYQYEFVVDSREIYDPANPLRHVEIRGTVAEMIKEHNVYVTDWVDARDISIVDGRFDLDDFIDYLIEMIEDAGLLDAPYNYRIGTPREHARRGGHVAVEHDAGPRIAKALKQAGLIPDFRPPDVIRLAAIPLYTSFADCRRVVEVLKEVIDSGAWLAVGDGRELVA